VFLSPINANGDEESLVSRRGFLRKAAILTGGAIITQQELFAYADSSDVKSIKLRNIHQNKLYKAEFFEKNCYKLSGLFEVNKAFIDYRAHEITRIDIDLINLLYDIGTHIGLDKEFSIVSGYRSKHTNNMLRRHMKGVAKDSFHTKGKAVDIYVPGVKLRRLRDIAIGLGRGGVGYYPRSNFVHVDVGPVRTWRKG
jgi:uncharacterized protein YcbK (DUF882 family)